MRILIIEDNYEFSQMLSAFLREAGFETDTALSGREGVKSSLYFSPDLILLDYHLGDMTGYDVAVAIKHMRNTANIPFIVLSSLGADPLLICGFKRIPSCRATLVKTQPLEELLKTIRKILPDIRLTDIKE
jgi:DNA-binding response OmpR family regulator